MMMVVVKVVVEVVVKKYTNFALNNFENNKELIDGKF